MLGWLGTTGRTPRRRQRRQLASRYQLDSAEASLPYICALHGTSASAQPQRDNLRWDQSRHNKIRTWVSDFRADLHATLGGEKMQEASSRVIIASIASITVLPHHRV
ncbi:hypothetical protein PENSUB_3932 [Penicillium subrubescens]|uniref:Uncharacterized protein n=1 Tax=Penicillium subrubescens TaxID=1316194 RepID=A0A1Q5UDU1_9EURO|nr:hypothetical protein PENSUB_3932 [Penicillium subrubescens]